MISVPRFSTSRLCRSISRRYTARNEDGEAGPVEGVVGTKRACPCGASAILPAGDGPNDGQPGNPHGWEMASVRVLAR